MSWGKKKQEEKPQLKICSSLLFVQLWIPRSALSLPLVLTMLTCTVLFYTSRAPRARLVKQGQLENKECEGHR